MFGIKSWSRKGSEPAAPSLLERAFAEGCTRLAVISLHPGAGARTVLEHSAAEFQRRGVAVGVTRAPRLPLDAHRPDAVAPIALPEGAIVATTWSPEEQQDVLEPLGPAFRQTILGDLGLFRVKRAGPLRIYGPDDAESMRETLLRLDERSDGLVLVDGAWERRGFAAPGGAQGVVLVVGAGYSGNAERSAAAVTYTVELLSLGRAADPALRAWPDAVARGHALPLDADGQCLSAPVAEGEALAALLEALAARVAAVVLPGGLHDDLLGPLIRTAVRCALVVRDPTCVRVAPIYYRAWAKAGGTVSVVDPLRLLAVATNPVNGAGPDEDPESFRQLVAQAVPSLSVHDIVLEARRSKTRRGFSILPRS